MRFHVHLVQAIILVVIACGLTAAFDTWLLDRSFLHQGMPILDDPYFWLRRGVSCACGLAFAALVIRGRDPGSVMSTGSWGGSAGAIPAAIAIVATACLSALQASDPAMFHAFAREDAAGETLSAVFLLVGALVLAAAVASLARRPRGHRAGILPAAMFAIVLFVIGMEELSWMQRTLAVETPDWISVLNAQRETNFHNMATYASELTYYLGGFVLLALFPLIADAGPPSSVSRRYSAFVPGRFVLVAGAMTTLFSAKIWDAVLAQIAYFGSIGALVGYAMLLNRAGRRGEVVLFVVAALVLAACGPLTLFTHEGMVRSWDDTEIKEFLLAFALAFYAVQTAARLMKSRSPTTETETELLSTGNIRAADAQPVS